MERREVSRGREKEEREMETCKGESQGRGGVDFSLSLPFSLERARQTPSRVCGGSSSTGVLEQDQQDRPKWERGVVKQEQR